MHGCTHTHPSLLPALIILEQSAFMHSLIIVFVHSEGNQTSARPKVSVEMAKRFVDISLLAVRLIFCFSRGQFQKGLKFNLIHSIF